MKRKGKNTIYYILAFAFIVVTVGCSSSGSKTEESSTVSISTNEATAQYDVVKKSDTDIKIDGKLDEDVWEEVPTINGGFHYPWEDKEAPNTVFKAFHDTTNLYFSFVATDKNVVVEDDWKDDESTVDDEDRVELFFAGSAIDQPGAEGIEKYYGIEVDPKGRVHDYSIVYYRDFDSKWNLEGLETNATVTDDGYIVEGKVPISSLEELKLINNNVMRVGVFRAEFSKEDNSEDLIMQWISWINPKTAQPDFHVDSAFGEFRFLQE